MCICIHSKRSAHANKQPPNQSGCSFLLLLLFLLLFLLLLFLLLFLNFSSFSAVASGSSGRRAAAPSSAHAAAGSSDRICNPQWTAHATEVVYLNRTPRATVAALPRRPPVPPLQLPSIAAYAPAAPQNPHSPCPSHSPLPSQTSTPPAQ